MIMSNIMKSAADLMRQETVKNRFSEILGKKAVGFVTSVLNQLATDTNLSKCDPNSVYSCAMVAAILDLPIDRNLGFSYIIPYNTKATFQIGYKGLIQLAIRSGQFKTISVTPIAEGQIVENNPLTGFKFDFAVQSEKICGYAAYFELINGFSKTLYMTTEQIKNHAGRFSQTYKKGSGIWQTDFDAMACKTVLKQILKFAPLSIEMQKAVIFDQGTPTNLETGEVEYNDMPENEVIIETTKENLPE